MTDHDRILIQRGIAAAIDHPSIYMGGPSKGSMRKALAIIEGLEAAGRLVPATCDHSAWSSRKEHGTCCPTCGLDIEKDTKDV